MKAVILAAGTGARISAVTSSPKCLLRFNGQAIIDYQLQALRAAGIGEFAIVVGYKGAEVVEHVVRHQLELLDDITFISNPIFDQTDNIYSLWLASEWIGNRRAICLDSDILFHPRIPLSAMGSSAGICMLVDGKYRQDAVKVSVREGHVLEVSKNVPPERASGTYAGAMVCGSLEMIALVREMELLLTSRRERELYSAAVEHLIHKGAEVSCASTQDLPWADVDDAESYSVAGQFNWDVIYDTQPPMNAACSPRTGLSSLERLQP